MKDIELNTQDLTYLEWSKIRNSSGTAGSFLKATEETGVKKLYYKLSDYDSVRGVTGHECVNEIIVDRLLSILGIKHLKYRLINSEIFVDGKTIDTFLCVSEDFKERGEEKLALDAYFDIEKSGTETPLEFCIRKGWDQYIYEMLVVDFLILNRDRHGANIEVLRNPKRKTIRLAPLFDHGLSLLCRCRTPDEIEKFDVLEDKRIQCYVGTASAMENLKLIPKSKMPNLHKLKERDKEILFEGLSNIVTNELLEKIWDMIWKRWCIYEDFCNKE